MPVCTQCGKRKPVEGFHADPIKRNGLKSHCKNCACRQSRRYYHAHRTQRLAYTRTYHQTHPDKVQSIGARQRRRNYELVRGVKDKPCADCGISFIPFVMDLDHVRGRKLFALGAIGTRSITAIQKEIAKCDVVCSNCHRLRTWRRMQRRKCEQPQRRIPKSG